MSKEITQKINQVYAPLMTIARGVILLKGGSSSGKSVAIQQKLISHCLEGRGILALRKVQKDARYTVYLLFEKLLRGLGIYEDFTHDRTNWEFRYKYGPGFIRCGGLDDPQRIKSVVGVDIVFLEEATEFMFPDYTELQRRVRGTKHKLFILAFNPMSEYSWINVYFYKQLEGLERGLEGKKRIGRGQFAVPDPVTGRMIYLTVRALTTNYTDNIFLTAEDRASIELLRDSAPSEYRVYGEAKWGIAEGVIVSNYRVELFDKKILDHMRQRSDGLDFGFTHNTAFLRGAYIPSKKQIYIYGGFYATGLITPEIITNLSLASFAVGDRIIADSADPGRIKEIRRAGFPIQGAEKGAGSISEFVRWAREQEWIIHPDAQFLADEFSGWKFRKSKGEKIDVPADGTESNPDDAIAAARYLSEPWRVKETRGEPSAEPVEHIGNKFGNSKGF